MTWSPPSRMTFYAFGLNHQTAPLNVREAFALDGEAVRALLATLQLSESAELVVLSTCNRTEAYLHGTEADVRALQSVLSWRAGRAWRTDHAFLVQDEAAIRHLLRVAAGLESLVLGDAQILAQLKDAYRLATEENRVGGVMHRLMHTAFRGAKRVANETGLLTGAASVSGAAIAAARAHFDAEGGLVGRSALLVGAGQMGRLALSALRGHGLARLAVTNRSPERAAELAAASGATVVDWEERHAALADVDLAIVATGAQTPVLLADCAPGRDAERPLLVVDIAVPRNVDVAFHERPGYRLLTLDTLEGTARRTQAQRRAHVPDAEAIIDELLGEFVSWVFHHQAMLPAIQAIRDTFEHVRVLEIERHHHRFTAADREELDRLTQSILQKLLAVPVVRLKGSDPHSIGFVQGIHLLQHLFTRPGCEDDLNASLPACGTCPYGQPADAPPVRPPLPDVVTKDETGSADAGTSGAEATGAGTTDDESTCVEAADAGAERAGSA